jgi:hypothetical protein
MNLPITQVDDSFAGGLALARKPGLFENETVENDISVEQQSHPSPKVFVVDVSEPGIVRIFDFPRGSAPFFNKSNRLPHRGTTRLNLRRPGSGHLKRDDLRFDMKAHQVIADGKAEGIESGGFGDSGHNMNNLDRHDTGFQ